MTLKHLGDPRRKHTTKNTLYACPLAGGSPGLIILYKCYFMRMHPIVKQLKIQSQINITTSGDAREGIKKEEKYEKYKIMKIKQ